MTPAQLAALYRGAELVALPSLYEGFGLPVVEALRRRRAGGGERPAGAARGGRRGGALRAAERRRGVDRARSLRLLADDDVAGRARGARPRARATLRLARAAAAHAEVWQAAAAREGAGRRVYCRPPWPRRRPAPPAGDTPPAAAPTSQRGAARGRRTRGKLVSTPSSCGTAVSPTPRSRSGTLPPVAPRQRESRASASTSGRPRRAHRHRRLHPRAARGAGARAAASTSSPWPTARRGTTAGCASTASPSRRSPRRYGVLWQQLAAAAAAARAATSTSSGRRCRRCRCCGDTPAVVTVHDLTTLLLPETHRLKVQLTQVAAPRPQPGAGAAHPRRLRGDGAPTCASSTPRPPTGCAWSSAASIAAFRPGERRARSPPPAASSAAPTATCSTPARWSRARTSTSSLDAWLALRDEHARLPPLVLVGGYGWKSRGLARATRGARRRRRPPARLARRRRAPARPAGGALLRLPEPLRGLRLAGRRGARLRRAHDRRRHQQPARGGGRRGAARRPARPRRPRRRACAACSRSRTWPPTSPPAARGRRRASRWERSAEQLEAVLLEAMA